MLNRKLLDRFLANNALVFLTAALVHGLGALRGPKLSPDGYLYIRLTGELMHGHLAGILDGSVNRFHEPQWPKLLTLSFVTLLRMLMPLRWMAAIVVINVLCSAATAMLIVAVVRTATPSVAARAATLLFYLTAFTVASWIPFVLTDVMFLLVSFSAFALLARALLLDRTAPRAALLGLALMATLTRPPGVVLIPLVILSLWFFVRPWSERRRRALAILLAALVIASVLVRTAIAADPGRWPFHVLRPTITAAVAREKQGEVIHDRVEAYRPPPHTYFDYLILEGDRFARYFQFTSSGFSRLHNAVGAAYFLPLYLLSLVGVLAGWHSPDRRRRAFVRMLVLWVGTFAFFHAMTVLDFDWRFRVPVMPHLIMLASLGVEALALLPARRPVTLMPNEFPKPR